MAIVETTLSGCYHNLIFDKFLQLGYQILVKLIVLLQMPKCKKLRCFFKSTSFLTSFPIAKHSANLMGFKRCLRRTFSKYLGTMSSEKKQGY